MLTVVRRRLARDALCTAAGILVALCVAAPIAELPVSVASDGPNTRGIIARRLYGISERYAVAREQPMIRSLDGSSDQLTIEPCQFAIAGNAAPRDDDPRRFADHAIWRLRTEQMRQAFQEPALDALVKRPPLLLKALEGCVRGSLLATLCGRYVMSVAAQARDGRRDAISRAQENVARTTEAAYCSIGSRGAPTAPPRAR